MTSLKRIICTTFTIFVFSACVDAPELRFDAGGQEDVQSDAGIKSTLN